MTRSWSWEAPVGLTSSRERDALSVPNGEPWKTHASFGDGGLMTQQERVAPAHSWTDATSEASHLDTSACWKPARPPRASRKTTNTSQSLSGRCSPRARLPVK